MLLDDAFKSLRSWLWSGPRLRLDRDEGPRRDHAWWRLTGVDTDDVDVRLLVLAFEQVTSRTVDQLHFLTPESLRHLRYPTVLVVAPWLSPRARELIERRDLSYLDLAGNVLVRAFRPMLYVRLHGADVDPRPPERGVIGLRGPRINGLIRLLVDATPPYRAREVAAAAGLSESYVSRALRSMQEQDLIQRRGPVIDVDWAELLRQRSGQYSLLGDNRSRAFVAKNPRELVVHIRGEEAVVTGPYAVDEGGQLELYVPDARTFARAHQLQPAKTGANVLLLEPASTSQVARSRCVDGVRHAGYSQLVQDLLSGSLPDAGEELLDRLAEAPDWRVPLRSL